MTTGPHSSDERTEGGRAWLGGDGSTEGSERLARLFQIGRAERTLHAEKELAELMRRVRTLETELRALRRLDESDPYQAETSGISTVELRRPPEPGERDYELNRCQGFEVYAGQSGSASSRKSCTDPARTALTCSRSERGATADATRCSSQWRTSRRSTPPRPQ